MHRKAFVIALSVVFVLPAAGQQFPPAGGPPAYRPPGFAALLEPAQAPEPGQAAPMAQQAPAPETKPEPSGDIRIEVLEGEGGRNDIQTGEAVAPEVRVIDEKGQPVPGAEVVFTLPMGGPSGMFNGWVRTQTLRTGDDGVAAATGYAPNEVGGRFNIRVTATAGDKSATAVISQTNIGDDAPRTNRKKWIILGVAAGAAVGIIAGVAAGDGDAAAPVPVTINPGTITVGGPR